MLDVRVNDGRCPHCGTAHEPGIRVCPVSGLPISKGPAGPAQGASNDRRRSAPRPAPRLPAQAPSPRAAQPVPRSELVGGVIGDKYAVVGILGEGGMGVVYEAEHMAMGRIVAIKVLHPENAQKREAVTRLQHEAKVTGNLGHPNICEIYDMGRLEDGSPYVVMERLRGETLAQKIKDQGKVEPQAVVEIAMQVLSALGAAHASGIIHRDLKPENVFLAEKPGGMIVTKLLDFGISKAVISGGEDDGLGLTQTGMVMGTPYYMAPEQARGDRALDNRVDIWAVGVMMYEAMTGRRPFLAKNYNALLVKILTVWHRSLAEVDPTIPPALALVVDKALSKMPEDRYRSAADMQEALKRFLPRKEHSYPSAFSLASMARGAEPQAPQRPPQQAARQPQQPPAPAAAPANVRAPAPPTFGLPELDLHDETADGVSWTDVRQNNATAERATVVNALAEMERARAVAVGHASPPKSSRQPPAPLHAQTPPHPYAPPQHAPPPLASPQQGQYPPPPQVTSTPIPGVPQSYPSPPQRVAPVVPAAPPAARGKSAAPAAAAHPKPAHPSPPGGAPRPVPAIVPGVPVPPAAPRAARRSAAPVQTPSPPFAVPAARGPADSSRAHPQPPKPQPQSLPQAPKPPTPAAPQRSATVRAGSTLQGSAKPAAESSAPNASAPAPRASSRPAARVSQQGRTLKPLPQFSHEVQRTSEPPPDVDDETTIFEEPSYDADDDNETLVLVRGNLSIPKKPS